MIILLDENGIPIAEVQRIFSGNNEVQYLVTHEEKHHTDIESHVFTRALAVFRSTKSDIEARMYFHSDEGPIGIRKAQYYSKTGELVDLLYNRCVVVDGDVWNNDFTLHLEARKGLPFARTLKDLSSTGVVSVAEKLVRSLSGRKSGRDIFPVRIAAGMDDALIISFLIALSDFRIEPRMVGLSRKHRKLKKPQNNNDNYSRCDSRGESSSS